MQQSFRAKVNTPKSCLTTGRKGKEDTLQTKKLWKRKKRPRVVNRERNEESTIEVEAIAVQKQRYDITTGKAKDRKELEKKKQRPEKVERKKDERGRLLNRVGLDGKNLACQRYGSEYHFLKECDIKIPIYRTKNHPTS